MSDIATKKVSFRNVIDKDKADFANINVLLDLSLNVWNEKLSLFTLFTFGLLPLSLLLLSESFCRCDLRPSPGISRPG